MLSGLTAGDELGVRTAVGTACRVIDGSPVARARSMIMNMIVCFFGNLTKDLREASLINSVMLGARWRLIKDDLSRR